MNLITIVSNATGTYPQLCICWVNLLNVTNDTSFFFLFFYFGRHICRLDFVGLLIPCSGHLVSSHWRIWGGEVQGTHPLPNPTPAPRPKILCVHTVFGNNLPNNWFVPPNRPLSGKSWIRHCICSAIQSQGGSLTFVLSRLHAIPQWYIPLLLGDGGQIYKSSDISKTDTITETKHQKEQRTYYWMFWRDFDGFWSVWLRNETEMVRRSV